jgi:hypothetical protein
LKLIGWYKAVFLIMQLRTFCYVGQSLLVLTLRTELIFHEFIALWATVPVSSSFLELLLKPRVICVKCFCTKKELRDSISLLVTIWKSNSGDFDNSPVGF